MKLPQEFIHDQQNLLKAQYQEFAEALNSESPVSIRINPEKADTSLLSPLGGEEGIILKDRLNIPWCSTGYYLESRPFFTFDPLFHAGCYYVQEASSMFLEQAVKSSIHTPVNALDLCAAPGGKSTHLSALLPKGSLLVSNEVIRSRANILAENVMKWGNPSVVVTNNDPSDIGRLTHFFDVILADVPCSGEGMFRKDPVAIEEWSPGNVALCAERQRRIVAAIWPALKPGGLLIYSTCTYNTRENEENIQWISDTMGGEVLPVFTEPLWGVTGSLCDAVPQLPVSRFLPHRTKGEGFFMAVIRKKDESEVTINFSSGRSSRSGESKKKNLDYPQELRSWLNDPQDFFIVSDKNEYQAIPLLHQEKQETLKKTLRVIHAGVPLGELKGKDLIPAHALSLSSVCRPEAFPALELTLKEAIHYLRKEALFNIPEKSPKGYNLITYKGRPLGFIKNIGSRANNLYPQEWRIRKNPI